MIQPSVTAAIPAQSIPATQIQITRSDACSPQGKSGAIERNNRNRSGGRPRSIRCSSSSVWLEAAASNSRSAAMSQSHCVNLRGAELPLNAGSQSYPVPYHARGRCGWRPWGFQRFYRHLDSIKSQQYAGTEPNYQKQPPPQQQTPCPPGTRPNLRSPFGAARASPRQLPRCSVSQSSRSQPPDQFLSHLRSMHSCLMARS